MRNSIDTFLLKTGEVLVGGVQRGRSQAMSASGAGDAPEPDAPKGLEGLEAEPEPDAPEIPSFRHQAGQDILAVRRR
jgi:hypothetical protein